MGKSQKGRSIRAENVFINCPYDGEYLETLRSILFTVRVFGFKPRMALESSDSGSARFFRIVNLIKQCPYAIHDLSRIQMTRPGEFSRMNMPFELGLDIGCRVFGATKWSRKKCLVLEREAHSIKAALSDLAGFDARSHEGDAEKAVREVRNWLVQEANASGPSGTKVWYDFNDFMSDVTTQLRAQYFVAEDIEAMPLSELLRHMATWIASSEGSY